jgi:glycosyltransferase involved in cell wall biosynthesis
MKITIITVVYNREAVIGRCIQSLENQSYKDVQHIIIDGGSTDQTLNVIKKNAHPDTLVISEKDNGMYDALNKGLDLVDGDIVGVLHSDDIFYNSDTLAEVAKWHAVNPTVDGTYGDVLFRRSISDHTNVRVNRSRPLNIPNVTYGIFPGHTSVFLKMNDKIRDVRYNVDFKIGGDFEYMVRLLVDKKIELINMNMPLSIMEIGGLSTKGFSSYVTLSHEMINALRLNNIHSSKYKIYFRALRKLNQFMDANV